MGKLGPIGRRLRLDAGGFDVVEQGMGHRANLIIRHEKQYDLYYSHWCAISLGADLFWGPDAALAFIRRQHSEAEGAAWLDEIWGEGGVVLDPVERVLLWFSSGDLACDVPLRRLHLSLMREQWPGWRLRWAHGHLAELATYLGRPLADLLDDPLARRGELDPEQRPFEVREPIEPDWINALLSARCADGAWKIHALDSDPAELARAGPSLLPPLLAADLPAEYDYGARTDEFPLGGIHIDEGRRRVDVWIGPPRTLFEQRLRAAWPGWDVRWHGDDFEAVAGLLGGRLVLPSPSPDALLPRIREAVLRERTDGGDLIRSVREAMAGRSEGAAGVRVNPLAMRDDLAQPPGPGCAQAFDLVVERWRSRQS